MWNIRVVEIFGVKIETLLILIIIYFKIKYKFKKLVVEVSLGGSLGESYSKGVSRHEGRKGAQRAWADAFLVPKVSEYHIIYLVRLIVLEKSGD